jgi:hypothetical protein
MKSKTKKAISNTVKELWKDPLYREKQLEARRKAWKNSERKRKHVERLKEYFSKKINRSKHSKAAKKSWSSKRRESMSKKMKKLWKDPEYQFMIGMIQNNPSYKKEAAYKAKKSAKLIDRDPVRKLKKSNRCSKAALEHWKKPESIKVASKIAKKHWKDPKYQIAICKAAHRKPNKAEKKLDRILQKILPKEYKYVGDFTTFIGGKNPDFINIGGKMKLIELAGDYWHDKSYPKKRIKCFKRYGFDTLVIWESELRDLNNLIIRIKEFNHDA